MTKSYVAERIILFDVLGKSTETETTTWLEYSNDKNLNLKYFL